MYSSMVVSKDIIAKVKKHVFLKNISKDSLMPSTGEIESKYTVKTHSSCPNNIFVISTIVEFQSNKIANSRWGVYPFRINGDFDEKFDVEKCKGKWFLGLKNVDETI